MIQTFLAILASSSYYIKIGGWEFLKFFILIQILYVMWRVADDLKAYYVFKSRDSLAITKQVLRYFLKFNAFLVAGLIGLGGIVTLAYKFADPSTIAANNVMFMEWDKQVFGSYVPLWLNSTANAFRPYIDIFGFAIINVFLGIGFMMSFSWALLLSLSSRRFFQMILGLGCVVVLSPPVWATLPSLSPMQGIIDNVRDAEIPAEITEYMQTVEPNPAVENVMDLFRAAQDDGNGGRYISITTFPSMHVAWATVLTYFAIKTRRKLAYVYLPYLFFNMCGTIYLMQHYAVDIPAGLVVSAITIFIMEWFVTGAPRFLTDMTALIQDDLKRFNAHRKRYLHFGQSKKPT